MRLVIAATAIALLANSTVFPATYKEAAALSCSRYTAEWNGPAGKPFIPPLTATIYKKAGDTGANLGNACGVAEYLATICATMPTLTVGDAVKELLRREAAGVEPPAPKLCPP
jgi:hypothetical protein